MRIGIIGYGRWGPNHARNFDALADLVSIADPDPVRRQVARERYPGVAIRHDFRDTVAESDAVIVATPVHTHRDIVLYALAQGKHVLCEKPLCLTAKVARELHQVAREQRRVLMTGYTYLYNARARWILQAVDFGQIYSIQADTVNLGPVRSDVGVIADLATHHIALIQSWMGRALTVSATGAHCMRQGHKDAATVCLTYEDKVYASIYVSWLAPRKSRLFRVAGEKRTVEWDDANTRTPICVYDGGARPREYYDTEADFMHLSAWAGDRLLPGVPHVEPLRTQAQHFMRVAECGVHGFAAFDEGVCATLEAARRSMHAGGASVLVEARR